MDVILMQSPVGDSVKKSKKKRRKQRSKKQAVEKNGAETRDQMDANLEASDKTRDCGVANHKSTMDLLGTDLTVQPLGENPKMDAGSTQNLSEGNGKRKKKKRLKRNKKKATIKDEVLSMDQKKMDARSTEDLVEGNATSKSVDEVQSVNQSKLDTGSTEHLAEGNVTAKRKRKRKSVKKAKIQDEVHSLDQTKMNLLQTDLTVQPLGENPKMDAGSTQNLSDGKVKRKKKKRPRKNKNKATIEDEVLSMDQTKTDAQSTEDLVEGNATCKRHEVQKLDTGSTENLAEGNVTGKRKRKRKSVKKAKIKDEVQSVDQIKKNTGSTEVTVITPDVVEVSCYEASSGLVVERLPSDRLMEFEGKLFPCESEHRGPPNHLDGRNEKFENRLSEVSNEIILDHNDEGKGLSEGRSLLSACSIRVTEQFASCDAKDEKCLRLEMAPITSTRRKLLVLDLNGILADVVRPPPRNCRNDIKISKRQAVFMRPFCDDFLRFCFENFDVGIWSSRSKIVVGRIVNYLLGDLKDKLLFCWDMSHSTRTRFKTLENCHKPMVFKELRKIWESDNPNLPWKKGDYNESNTLLLDDSPYKALLNPSHTAIFPSSYHYMNKNDNSLGPGGDLRVYLEGLVKSENVQKYVEQHPFGQRPINENNLSWQFYAGVISCISNKLNDKPLVPDVVSVKT